MRSWLRADLLIAVCALLISSLSCLATVYQTRVIANQLSASVWPYLSYTATFDQGSIAVSLDNAGLGPALVRSATLTIDGRRVTGWEVGGKTLGDLRGIKTMSGSFTSVDPSTVIRAGETHRLFRLSLTAKTPADRNAATDKIRTWFQKRVTVSICYCSTLGQCWLTSTGRSEEPQSVHRCPAPSSINA